MTGRKQAWSVTAEGGAPAAPPSPPGQGPEVATARAAVGLGWGWGRWAPPLGEERLAQRRWDWAGRSGPDTPGPCGAGRERARRRWRASGGRGARSGPKGRRARSGSRPSAGRHAGKAETRSGRGRARAPSADSPGSCANSPTATVKYHFYSFLPVPHQRGPLRPHHYPICPLFTHLAHRNLAKSSGYLQSFV